MVVVSRVRRRSGSRVSLNCLRRHCVPRHQVSELTLGPLGQPEKAMGLESPIELWLASDNRSACLSQNRLASSHICDENAKRNPQDSHDPVRASDGMERKAGGIPARG